MNNTSDKQSNHTILVIDSTGKTGKRVTAQLEERGIDVRHGSRSAGVMRLVLLSRRGEEQAAKAEEVIKAFGLEWTILRCAFFAQNFSEGAWLDEVRTGAVVLPVGDVQEPFGLGTRDRNDGRVGVPVIFESRRAQVTAAGSARPARRGVSGPRRPVPGAAPEPQERGGCRRSLAHIASTSAVQQNRRDSSPPPSQRARSLRTIEPAPHRWCAWAARSITRRDHCRRSKLQRLHRFTSRSIFRPTSVTAR